MFTKTTNATSGEPVAFRNSLNLRGQRQADSDSTLSPGNFQAKKKLHHLIYDRLISLLEGRTFSELPWIMHPLVLQHLRDEDGMTNEEIKALEISTAQGVGFERRSSTIPMELFRELGKLGKSNLIFDKRIVAVPDDDLNIIVCAKLEKEFARLDLLSCPGFVLEDGFFLRLDLDKPLVEFGFLMPIIPNKEMNLITGLRVFRFPNDEFHFVLKSRKTRGLNICP